jgi:hypothetical protein
LIDVILKSIINQKNKILQKLFKLTFKNKFCMRNPN